MRDSPMVKDKGWKPAGMILKEAWQACLLITRYRTGNSGRTCVWDRKGRGTRSDRSSDLPASDPENKKRLFEKSLVRIKYFQILIKFFSNSYKTFLNCIFSIKKLSSALTLISPYPNLLKHTFSSILSKNPLSFLLSFFQKDSFVFKRSPIFYTLSFNLL